MALSAGVRLGPYRIEAPIGAGGMGEVYRARDTRLDRTIAIKLLAADIAADPQFRERFDREARTISSLDHPHICTLFDIGHDEAAGVDYLVMQYLEGETLADRLARAAQPKSDGGARPASSGAESAVRAVSMARGPIPLDQTLRYAVQIAGALDAAHRAGIVHRDLKPGNVMITKSGVKLLDFGLAKLRDPQASSAGGFTIAATQSAPLTEKGSLLGTLQYMSPEQLEGGDVDARSDIFSFGAMLFEMLTGQRAFDSKSQAGVIAAILNADPPPLATLADFKATLPVAVQRTLDRLLKKCLAKNPDDRWQCAADLADELRWIDQERLRGENQTDAGVAASTPQGRAPHSRSRERWWMGAATAACLVAAALAAWEFLRPPPPPAQTISFAIEAPDKQPFAAGPGLLAVSPDGRRLAFVAGAEKRRLWVRSLDSTTAQPLPGTDDAWQPSWSPDSRFIIFTAGTGVGKLKKIDVMGGPATTIADSNLGRAAWSPAGVIVFRARDGRLVRVGEGGGDATPVTELDKSRHETAHDWPVFLSDGRRFLFQARTSEVSQTALYLGSIDSMARTRLMDLQSSVDYANGYLLYSREGTLMAQPFDEKHGRLTGQPTPVVESLIYNVGNGRAAFSESTNGILAYRTGSNIRLLVLTWYDRTGKVLGTIGDAAEYSTPRVSPDGRRLILARRDATGHTDLWIFDLDRGVPTRFTSDPADDGYPVWSPDGTQVIFASNRKGINDLYVRQAGGAGPEELLYASPEGKIPTSISPDGGLLLFNRGMPGMGSDIWALPLKGDRKPFPVVATPFNEGFAVFSPDGRWIAYDSTDTGPLQVYVQPFPATGARVQLSTTTGTMPTWTADGRSVVYATADKRLMVVDVTPSGKELKPSLPRELPIPLTGAPNPRLFAMAASGQRFLVPMEPVAGAEAPITVVVNWMNGLKK